MKASDLDNPCRRNAAKRSREMGQGDSDMESRGQGAWKIACLYADENGPVENENV